MKRYLQYILFLLGAFILFACEQKESYEVEINIDNHIFNPNIIEVPTDKKIILVIHNNDDSVEEFDSISLKREKMIPPKSTARITLAPLQAGEYEFTGEFHEETAHGKLVVKQYEGEK